MLLPTGKTKKIATKWEALSSSGICFCQSPIFYYRAHLGHHLRHLWYYVRCTRTDCRLKRKSKGAIKKVIPYVREWVTRQDLACGRRMLPRRIWKYTACCCSSLCSSSRRQPSKQSYAVLGQSKSTDTPRPRDLAIERKHRRYQVIFFVGITAIDIDLQKSLNFSPFQV